jgi:dihydroneopterin aldolase
MMDKIKLSRMQFYGYHGVFPEENKLGQRFFVDVELSLDLAAAGRTDDLSQTVNYAEVYERIRRIVEGQPFRLIEALAEKIASDLLHQYTRVNDVAVRVVKPHPPFDVQFDGVTVEIVRKRESL